MKAEQENVEEQGCIWYILLNFLLFLTTVRSISIDTLLPYLKT